MADAGSTPVLCGQLCRRQRITRHLQRGEGMVQFRLLPIEDLRIKSLLVAPDQVASAFACALTGIAVACIDRHEVSQRLNQYTIYCKTSRLFRG